MTDLHSLLLAVCRPCCVSEADDSHIRCWMHAAAAGSLPVLWQQHQLQQHQQSASTLAPHEEQQLLADIAVAAAATLCNECFSSSLVARQVDGAAAHLLAAALLPGDVVYGSHRSCTSRFMAAMLGSNCCHVLLHALAVSNTSSEQATLLAAAAAAAVASATQASSPAGSRSVTPDQHDGGAAVHSARSSIVLAPVHHELQPAWLLLRMISAQCAAVAACADSNGEAAAAGATRSSSILPSGVSPSLVGGSDDDSMHRPPTHVRQQVALLQGATSTAAAASAVRPEQVLRVVQAYSSHITTGSDAQVVPGLLRSLHFLMCQSVLVLRHGRTSIVEQQAMQQQGNEPNQRERLQWLSLTTDEASSSSSNNNGVEDAELGGAGQQLLATAAAVLHLIHSSQEEAESAAAAAGTAPAALGNGTSSRSGDKGSGGAQQLSWSLTASVYVALAIAVHLQERALSTRARHQEHLSASDSCLALAGIQLAAAALKLLLPVVVPAPQQAAAAAAAFMSIAVAAPLGSAAMLTPPQQQANSLVLPVYEVFESSLAAAQALATLTALLQPALPELLSQCLSNSSGHLGQQSCAAPSSREGSTPVKLPAARAAIAAAAAALDADLCKLLSQVVLSWQAHPGSHAGQSGGRVLSDRGELGVSSGATDPAYLQLSVQSGLQQHLWQELRCLSAAALASCYGQLGAPTPQGAVLGPFRECGSPFADVRLQLRAGQPLSGHAAVLATGCPVLRQQLVSAAGAAGQANGCIGSHGRSSTALVLKLSAAVDYQALQQALDFIYTGAAVLPHAGLASQLQLSSSCLAAARQQGRGQLSEQRQSVLLRQPVQELLEQQQTARQQLHKLGMLARKLQLPLLAALTRGNRPQPGQRLPDLHLSFAALLPHQVVLSGGSCACQQHPPQQQDQQESVSVQQAPKQVHPSSTEYLDLLAACTAANHAGVALCYDAAGPAAGGSSNGAAVSSGLQAPCGLLTGLAGGLPEACFADVYMAAPANLVHTPGSHSAAPTLQQQSLGSGSAPGQGELVLAFLPAHRVILSGCCPYFEALLSDRWQHEEQHVHGPRHTHSTPGQQANAAGAQVALVPEADIHVAAALQHYLYTNSLKVQLPAETAMMAAAGTAAGARVGTGGVIRLNGCCAGCHTARTLLRLWRCAELLLLPQLQALCLAAVEAAASQLDTRCCLVVLADCCHLGVPAAADGLLAVLMQTAGE